MIMSSQLHHRRIKSQVVANKPRYEPLDWDDSLPYGGKVYLARRKKPDTWLCVCLQVSIICACLMAAYWCHYHFDHFHYHVTNVYAHLGHTEAQHLLGQRYLQGRGVDKDHQTAMKWFRHAADSGHAHASYNLAVGHLQGLTDTVKPGEAQTLLEHASRSGVSQADHVLNTACSRGDCSH